MNIDTPVLLVLLGVVVGVIIQTLAVFLAMWINKQAVKLFGKESKGQVGVSDVTTKKVVVAEEPVVDSIQVIEEKIDKPLTPPRYEYFVANNKEPFLTLREALTMFPAEKIKNPVWDKLPQYVRDNIKREPVA